MGSGIPYRTVWQHWPKDAPLLCLGGSGWNGLLVTAYREVSWHEVAHQPFMLSADSASGHKTQGAERELCGTVGIISYDHGAHGTSSQAPARFFRIHEAVTFDQERQVFRLAGSRHHVALDFALDPGILQRLLDHLNHAVVTPLPSSSAVPSFGLMSREPAEAYLAKVEKVLEDIREGRYYQLNLLRYFSFSETPSEAAMAVRMDAHAGPMSAWIKLPRLNIISFSPERFVRAAPDPRGSDLTMVETAPIKGTIRRSEDPRVDRSKRQELSNSLKDRAELAMIIDLMRHDLGRISIARSVAVEDPGTVHTFSHVHHLMGRVRSLVEPNLLLEHFLAALCPAGSITGAPKIEVMAAIRSYEERERGYFMGHIMYWDGRGHLDSSILIRTAVQQSPSEVMEFAAGSGLVIRSEPRAELAEINAKTEVVRDDKMA